MNDYKIYLEKKEYTDLLYAIRPAFGGSIMANIINWDMHPQMATVREGVMKKEILDANYKGELIKLDVSKYIKDSDFAISIIDREIEESKIDIKNKPIILAGGYGMGSKDGFDKLFELAAILGAGVGASRAAVDAESIASSSPWWSVEPDSALDSQWAVMGTIASAALEQSCSSRNLAVGH